MQESQSSTTSAWIPSTSSPTRFLNWEARSAWQKRWFRRWAISLCVRIPRVTPLDFGKAIRQQFDKIICPKPGCSFVVVLKAREVNKINYQPKQNEHTKS